jgi:hypothetical protein
MTKRIIYPNNVGGIALITPAPGCGIAVEEIARKDVPAGKPYLIVDTESVPGDFVFFEAWEADFSEPHGIGIGPRAWFIEQYQIQIAAINAEPALEIAVGEDVLAFAERANQWTANKEFRIAQLNQMIAVQQAEMGALT